MPSTGHRVDARSKVLLPHICGPGDRGSSPSVSISQRGAAWESGGSTARDGAQPASITLPAGSTAYQSGMATPFVSPAAWSPAK